MWPPRLASLAIFGVSVSILAVWCDLSQIQLAEEFSREFPGAGSLLVHAGILGAFLGSSGFLASFGLELTASGFEPKKNRYGRLIGLLTTGCRSYCAVSASFGYAIFATAITLNFLVLAVIVIVRDPPHAYDDPSNELLVALFLGTAFFLLAGAFLTPYGRRHWANLLIGVAFDLWLFSLTPAWEMHQTSSANWSDLASAICVAMIVYGVVLLIWLLRRIGLYERICPIRAPDKA